MNATSQWDPERGGLTDWGRRAAELSALSKADLFKVCREYAPEYPTRRTKAQMIASIAFWTRNEYNEDGNLKTEGRSDADDIDA